jgi:predicted heme/steroid binding protein/uncharacterized membrane protein
MKSFDREALSKCNGKDGNPIHIAHKGNVYDVSQSKLWKGGSHMRRHEAGTDLTADIAAAPHGPEVLERYPQVGVLEEAAPAGKGEQQELNSEALSRCNGEGGRPAYIAHQGKVYDVSDSKLWKGGSHMRRHAAGSDLTTDIQAAPHGPEVLERYPQVGVLKTEAGVAIDIPPALDWLLKRVPFLRRHPHPMTVHFPIVCMMFAPVFSVLYLLTGVASFETTAFHCLGAGILFACVAISTGWYTWWLNYMAHPVLSVKIKKPLSLAMLALAVLLFLWRLAVPDILTDFTAVSRVYLMLELFLIPMIGVIGWFGAILTFPLERE